MAIETVRLVEIDEYLSTEALGKSTRRQIHALWDDSYQIVCDFSQVLGMTGAFADEAFGKMLVEFGLDNYTDKIRFQNLNDVVQAVLKGTLYRRYREMKGGPDWRN
ncbi:MAG TPA: STAS-like domain-containing protein [bacterium]|nr:STAS-like domain-containing protein [bacterium]